jgi:hypothetical protein
MVTLRPSTANFTKAVTEGGHAMRQLGRRSRIDESDRRHRRLLRPRRERPCRCRAAEQRD